MKQVAKGSKEAGAQQRRGVEDVARNFYVFTKWYLCVIFIQGFFFALASLVQMLGSGFYFAQCVCVCCVHSTMPGNGRSANIFFLLSFDVTHCVAIYVFSFITYMNQLHTQHSIEYVYNLLVTMELKIRRSIFSLPNALFLGGNWY